MSHMPDILHMAESSLELPTISSSFIANNYINNTYYYYDSSVLFLSILYNAHYIEVNLVSQFSIH